LPEKMRNDLSEILRKDLKKNYKKELLREE
jgi:hypothetical protein